MLLEDYEDLIDYDDVLFLMLLMPREKLLKNGVPIGRIVQFAEIDYLQYFDVWVYVMKKSKKINT